MGGEICPNIEFNLLPYNEGKSKKMLKLYEFCPKKVAFWLVFQIVLKKICTLEFQ